MLENHKLLLLKDDVDQFHVTVGDKDDCSMIELLVEMPMQCNYPLVEATRMLVSLLSALQSRQAMSPAGSLA